MHVVLKPSPSVVHKYRVILPSKRAIDFGKKSVQYYTDHGDAHLMRAHLIRKGAVIPKKLRIETNHHEIHRGMLAVDESERKIGKTSSERSIGNDGCFCPTPMLTRPSST